MTTQELGTLENVDLHEVWPNEASDFTPWLQTNLRSLSDVLGIEMEIQEREAPVGSFSLDLLARDLGRDRVVIIENQLTVTDHDHLGKLLTYAAGYNAGVVVWLARELREEHRQALDWLNQRTDTETEFYGVEVEVLRIGDSPPAPNFKLIAFPNEWRKSKLRSIDSGRATARGEAYRTYFQSLIDELRDRGFTGARKAQPQSWFNFASGFRDIVYGTSFTRSKQARVELYIDRDQDWNKSLFDELKQQQQSLEAELGEPLEWERLDTGQASRIAVYRGGSIDDDSETLAKTGDWAIEHLLKFKEVFRPRLEVLVR